MTLTDIALFTAHQIARQAKHKPGDADYEALLDRVSEQMDEPKFVRVGDHDPEPARNAE